MMPYLLISIQSIVIYLLIIASFRMLGKKGLAEISIADLVLIVLIGEALGSIYPEEVNKFYAALVTIVTLVVVNYILAQLTFRSKKIRHLIEGSPVKLVDNGNLLNDRMKRERVNFEDIEEAMRIKGIDDVKKVKTAVLETDGKITIVLKENSD